MVKLILFALLMGVIILFEFLRPRRDQFSHRD